MSAIEHIRRSDTIQMEPISYTLTAPILGTRNRTTMAFCITKGRGALAMTLAAEQLGIPVPSLVLPFRGTVDPSGTGITWEIDEHIDIWAHGVRFTHVQGRIVTNTAELPPSRGTACDGTTPRVFQAELTSEPTTSTITVGTSLGNAVVSNVAFRATAGEELAPVSFRVGIRGESWERDGCGGYYQLDDTTVGFTAFYEDLRAIGTVEGFGYEWTVSGAAIVGPADQRRIVLRFDNPGPVTLTVRLTIATNIEAGTFSSTLRFAVLTPEEVLLRQQMCRLRSMLDKLTTYNVVIRGVGPGFTIGGRRFVDPLWDPAPDQLQELVVEHAYSLQELNQIRSMLERVVKHSATMLEHTNRVAAFAEKRLVEQIKSGEYEGVKQVKIAPEKLRK